VPIAHNLRYDLIDHIVTADWLTAQTCGADWEAFFSEIGAQQASHLHSLLSFLHRWAQHLKAQREIVRGKPENFNRPDYNFTVDGPVDALPKGDEPVSINLRQRGSPLDLIVAEAMIFANSTWGAWLAQLGVPAIYRSQMSLAPGIKVRMGTKPAPHAGMGVKCYSWATSPLRRYTDLVNQWQLIAAVQHGATAALAAPFKPKDAQLFAIISAFEATYSAYNEFQTQMERYWTFQWLIQRGQNELQGAVIKDQPSVLVRADELPLVVQLAGNPGVARGERVRVQLGAPDLLDLTLGATLLEKLGSDAVAEEEDGEVEAPSGALNLAMDVNEVVAEEPSAS
jgi:exoribonuclease II